MGFAQWLTVAGVPAIISGLFLLAFNRVLAKRDKVKDLAEAEKAEQVRKQTEAAEEQQKAIIAQNAALMAGVQALLRDTLLKSYRHYAEKGWADYDDRQNLENVWKQYHELGANGVMDDMRARFLALPVRKEGEEK